MSSETKPFLTYHSNSSISSTTTLSPSTSSQPSYKQKIFHDVRSNIVSYTIVFALTTLLWMSIVFSFIPDESTQYHLRTSHPDARRHNVTSGMTLLTCGETKTNEEALEKGCKYDVLLNGWVPSPCYDQEFITEYLEDSSATAYLYPNLTHPLHSITEMTRPMRYYTSKRDHVNHCATMWKKQFWVLFEERAFMDSFIASPGHTDHCASYLADAGTGDMDVEGSTLVDVGFAGCWVRK